MAAARGGLCILPRGAGTRAARDIKASLTPLANGPVPRLGIDLRMIRRVPRSHLADVQAYPVFTRLTGIRSILIASVIPALSLQCCLIADRARCYLKGADTDEQPNDSSYKFLQCAIRS